MEQKGYVMKLAETNTQLATFIRDVSIFTKANDGLIELEGKETFIELATSTGSAGLLFFSFFFWLQPSLSKWNPCSSL